MYKSVKTAAPKLAALAVLSALTIYPAFAEDKPAPQEKTAVAEKSVALVNGISIPQSRVEMIVKNVVAQGQADSPKLRTNIRENLINREIVLQEAKAKGLDKLPDIQEQMEAARQEILINNLFQAYLKDHPISEDQLKQEYDKLKANLGKNEYSVRHVLVETEAEAKTIIAQLGKKGNFDKIAREKSKDAGTKERGGSLGWTVPNVFAPPFANALTSLKKGAYTKEPVQTQFGWHVIKLDDVRELNVPPFDDVKPQIQQRLQKQAIDEFVNNLRKNAKVE